MIAIWGTSQNWKNKLGWKCGIKTFSKKIVVIASSSIFNLKIYKIISNFVK